MPRSSRRLRPAVLALILLPAYLAPAAAQRERVRPVLAFSPFTFTAEGGATADADSARLVVPMNRSPVRGSTAAGRTVSLPVVRFRGTSSGPGVPVIYLSGGSGSGIAAARGPRFAMFQALRQTGDVIVFDLRGAGRSQPRITCPGDEPLTIDRPLDYAGLVAVLRRNAERCAAALRAGGIDPSGFNLRETVEDIEAIRVALGAEKVSLVGISTGSEIGLEYVRRHGGHVAHAVLAGVQGPDQTVDLPSDQEAVLREIAALGRARQASPGPDFVATLQSVITRLRTSPATVRVRDRRIGDSVTVRLGELDAQLLASAMLGDRRQSAMLPALIGAAAAGQYAPLAGVKLEASRGGINSAFEALQDCQTGVAQARRAARAREAETSLLGWGTLDFPEHCAGWGVAELDASWRAPVRSSASVLLISGTLDGRTSVRNAAEVLRGLRNGSHLVIASASHGDDLFLSSPRIVPTIVGFLRGERPAELRLHADPLPAR
jgi:pimeloyl-ACP methyl ester carboxylesterase